MRGRSLLPLCRPGLRGEWSSLLLETQRIWKNQFPLRPTLTTHQDPHPVLGF